MEIKCLHYIFFFTVVSCQWRISHLSKKRKHTDRYIHANSTDFYTKGWRKGDTKIPTYLSTYLPIYIHT